MSVALINWAKMNIWEHFWRQTGRYEVQTLSNIQIVCETIEKIQYTQWHNDKYRMIVNILNKCLVGLDNFEILIK